MTYSLFSSHRRLHKARVLITGASSGIGRALAVELARHGATLILTARRTAALRELADRLARDHGTMAIVVSGDITDAQTRQALVATMTEQCNGIDLLVNNAGAGATMRVEITPEETARRLMELNFFAPLFLTQQMLPLLKSSAAQKRETKNGSPAPPTMIINIGSIVGLRGTPHFGVYGAAKAALTNLSDALRAELAADPIDVLTVSPGTTSSEFFESLLENRSQPNFPRHTVVTPQDVAKQTVRAIIKGGHRILPHGQSRILHRLNCISPRFVDWLMARYR